MPNETLNMDLMRRMADLQATKKRLEAELRGVKSEIADIQQQSLNELTAAGVERLPMVFDDGSSITLYVHSQTWARPAGGPENRPAVIEALKEEGLSDLLKTDFNVTKLSAWVREMRERGDEIPERLLAVLDLEPTVEVRARQS